MTVKEIEALAPGAWLTETGARNEGALRAKGSPSGGASFYFRYRDSLLRYDDLPIGSFDVRGKRGLTLDQARAKVRVLRNRYLNGDRDLRAALDAERRESERQREQATQAAEKAAARQAATLGNLLTGYVDRLRDEGKPSARAVERALLRHVRDAWPLLWTTVADDVSADDLLAVVARVANDGKRREAGKLQSYIGSAYKSGLRARMDALALPALREMKITANPARDLIPIAGSAAGARDRALSVAELRAYWRRIEALPAPDGALLRFHLLTGGQRAEQLARLTIADLDQSAAVIKLRDPKGRRAIPRVHLIPLIPAAVDALRALRGNAGPHLFTVDKGLTGAAYASLQHRVRAVVEAMVKAGELEGGTFTPGDLRRTVETRLAAEGVPVHIRAQLQSHGLGGVQAKHYDRHDYLPEKRAALETLHRLCTDAAAQVIPIKRTRKNPGSSR